MPDTPTASCDITLTVNGREIQQQYFKSPGWEDPDLAAPIRDFRMDAFSATMAWTDATIKRQSDKASGYVDQLRWGGTIIPIIIGVVGGVALLAGIGLLVRRRPEEPGNRVE